jgi:hypothetical protein
MSLKSEAVRVKSKAVGVNSEAVLSAITDDIAK